VASEPAAQEPAGAQPSSYGAGPAAAADPFAAPAAASQPFGEPTTEVGAAEVGAAEVGAAEGSAPEEGPAEEAEVVVEPAGDATSADGGTGDVVDADVVDADVVDAEVIDVDAAVVEVDDGEHRAVFAALVARSRAVAERRGAVAATDEALVDAVVAGVGRHGFTLAERTDTDRGHELRFDGGGDDLVIVSLGSPSATRPEDLADDHVPIVVSYRTGTAGQRSSTGTGEHGEVVVSADEWTGQATAGVELFLGLGDYLGGSDGLDGDAVARDVAAAVAVVRDQLA
jgi:hypothetical protein